MSSIGQAQLQPSVGSLLNEFNSLISPPDVCLKLRQLIVNPDYSKQDVANLIAHDPALTTRVLRIVNSAYYGLAQPVHNISHALCILGERELNNLVLVTSLVRAINELGSELSIDAFWRSSVFSAVLACNLAKSCNYNDDGIETFFISGLLLNIGQLLLYYREPQLYRHVQTVMAKTGRPDFEIENEILGFDHADVGTVMAESWNFSLTITNSISEHHRLNPVEDSLAQHIMFSTATVSDQINLNNPERAAREILDSFNPEVLEKLRLDKKQFTSIMDLSVKEFMLAFEAFCGGQS